MRSGRRTAAPSSDGRSFPARTTQAMPHVWDMLSRYATARASRVSSTLDPRRRPHRVPGSRFRLALAGVRARNDGRARSGVRSWHVQASSSAAFCPTSILSQTVPLIALAPLVVSWGGQAARSARSNGPGGSRRRCSVPSSPSSRWRSARCEGLTSTPPASLELMDSYAASWRQTLFKLRFPAALPYIVPALEARGHGLGGRRGRGRALDRPRRRDRAG